MSPRSWHRVILPILCLALLAPIFAHAGPIDRWYWRSPQPTGLDLNGVAWGSGRYVAVGRNGIILTSRHGGTWAPRKPNVATWRSPDLRDVAWGNGRFVAVGDSSAIRVSTDGVLWQKINPGYEADLFGVAWCLDRFLAVGYTNGRDQESVILSSPDGSVWSKIELATNEGKICDVAYGNGVYVVACFGGQILFSTDGRTWDRATSPETGTLDGLTFGGGKFIAVGRKVAHGGIILTSTDGAAWVEHTVQTLPAMLGVAYGGGMFVAGTRAFGVLYCPSGGTNWTTADFQRGGNLGGLTWGGDGFVSVGQSGSIHTSPDGITWVERSSRVSNLGVTVWGNGRYLSVNMYGMVSQSVDGRAWGQESHPELSGTLSVTYGNGLFVAGGSGDEYNTGRILVSSDGHVWTTVASLDYFISHVENLGGIFLALGNRYPFSNPVDLEGNIIDGGAIYFSRDGRYWQRVFTIDGIHPDGIAYGNGAFVVAAYYYGLISWDAVNWFRWKLPDGALLDRIAYGNGTFIGISHGDQRIYSSSDGRNWELRQVDPLGSTGVLTFSHGWFIAGWYTMKISRDGSTWSSLSLEAGGDLRDIVSGPNSILAIGTRWSNSESFVLESGSFDTQ